MVYRCLAWTTTLGLSVLCHPFRFLVPRPPSDSPIFHNYQIGLPLIGYLRLPSCLTLLEAAINQRIVYLPLIFPAAQYIN